MARSKKRTQLDVIKSLRKELPPVGKPFKVKKNQLFRKRKHKGKIDTEEN